MKKLVLLFLFILLTITYAQDPVSISIENKPNNTAIGSLALVSGNGIYVNSFEVKVKKETTPTSGGFYNYKDGVTFLTTTSQFKILDWTGKTETGSWSTDGKKYTHTITNSAWQKETYKISLQLFNKNGNVGSPFILESAKFSAKELSAVYTAEGCTVAKDSTTGTKWKSEAKIKFTTPLEKPAYTLNKSSDADSLLLSILDSSNKVVLKFKYAISWADPKTFGININASLSTPANGTFINPPEKFTTTIELKNDNGDLLKLTETSTNKVEKLNVWIAGPKQSYQRIAPYTDIKLIDAYALKTVTGFDPNKNTYEVSLHDSLNLTPGTYTMLIRAKRKGYGPELEKYILKDFQVKQATPTVNPLESMYENCISCHNSMNKPLVKHNANDVKLCVVCHNNSLTGKELVTFGHKIHSGKGILACSSCHKSNVGLSNVKKLACITCHTALPTTGVDHTNFTDATCNGCHGSGGLSPINAHAKLTSVKKDDVIPTKTYLSQNYPNPFNPSTTISFSLSKTENVKLEIFNMLGEQIATLVNSKLQAGNYKINWNSGNQPSGIYIYRLQTNSYSQSRKMILMR